MARRHLLVGENQERQPGPTTRRVGEAERGGQPNQDAYHHPPRPLYRPVCRRGREERGQRTLRTRRQGVQQHGAQDTEGQCREETREEQIDAHRGMRDEPLSRKTRHRGGGNRPGRAHHPAHEVETQPHRHARHPYHTRGGGRPLPRETRLRTRQQRPHLSHLLRTHESAQ